jgi:hypothetical protein
MAWWAAIPAVLQTVGALQGMAQGQQSASASRARLQQAVAEISGIPVPELDKYTPEELINMGNFSPEEIQLLGLQGPSDMENIQLDPRLRADQETAIGQARERALRGFTAEDAAMLDQYMRQASNTAQSQTQAALQDMNRRGMSGSGNALAAALAGTQNAANQQSQQALQTAAMRLQAQDRNTDALARMAAGLEATDYNRAQNLATSRDSINQFNQQLRQRVGEANVGLRNTANLRNLDLTQGLSNANISERNKAQQVEQQRQQDQFNMRMTKGRAMAGQLGEQDAAVRNMDAAKAQGTANAIGGIGQIAATFGTMSKAQEEQDKKDQAASLAYRNKNLLP